MREEFGALPAQHLPRFVSFDAISLAVPQQALTAISFDRCVNCHFPSTKTAPAGGLPCGRLGDVQRFVMSAAVRIQ